MPSPPFFYAFRDSSVNIILQHWYQFHGRPHFLARGFYRKLLDSVRFMTKATAYEDCETNAIDAWSWVNG